MNFMIQTLLSGDFRHWGAAQYGQYRRLFGNTGKVGIEIEVPTKLSEKKIRFLKEKGFRKSYSRMGTEITFLYDTTDPFVFRNLVKETVQTLGQSQVCTLGALHINVQIRDKSYRKLNSRKGAIWVDTYQKYTAESIYRVEFKQGIGFVEETDLLAQLLMCLIWVNRGKNTGLISIIDEARNGLFNVDLNPLIATFEEN